jgi:pimeloyl-ACP methyl ester carboxylesterase
MSELKDRLKGAKDLVLDAVDATAQLVEDTQDSVADRAVSMVSAVPPLKAPAEAVDAARRLGARLTFGAIKGINAGVRAALDVGAALAPEGDAAAPPRTNTAAEAILGAVNGVVGDHLRSQGNGLDLGMRLRVGDRYFDPGTAQEALQDVDTARLVVFIHGLAVTETAWTLNAEAAWGDPNVTYASRLEAELGYTPIFVRYNSGLHISENGRELARHLEALVQAAPTPVRALVLVGHSMGGLLARSATHYAEADAAWLRVLTHVFTLGTPHQGSPLEKAGRVVTEALGAIATPATQVIAAVARLRSAAIQDLGDGLLVDEDWQQASPDAWLAKPRTEVPFLDGVTYVFVGATVTADPAHPAGKLVGDLLVRLPSSTHDTVQREQATFALDRHILGGADHVSLQNRPEVYAILRDRLAADREG